MAKVTTAVLSLILFLSCTRAHRPDVVTSAAGYQLSYDDGWFVTIEVPFEDAWWTVVGVLEEYGWTIEGMTEESGSIATEQLTMGTNRDPYACRRWPGSTARVDRLRAQLILHLSPLSDGAVILRINAVVEGRYVTAGSGVVERIAGWFDCNSTGRIEGEIFDAFLNRLEPIWYDSQVYRRGAPAR
ncbi:MAG: hypothetical protein JSW58_07330 [Candidatus Latescibacterota bacterium]|nr:MAG: hypothetical protein JSW58_07330 [Candidatus Latescibacterota bacterium]